MSTLIESAATTVRDQLTTSESAMRSEIASFDDDASLQRLSAADLDTIWASVASQLIVRDQLLQTFADTLEGLATDRVRRITAVLRSYAEVLAAIAYILPAETERLIFHESLVRLAVCSRVTVRGSPTWHPIMLI